MTFQLSTQIFDTLGTDFHQYCRYVVYNAGTIEERVQAHVAGLQVYIAAGRSSCSRNFVQMCTTVIAITVLTFT